MEMDDGVCTLVSASCTTGWLDWIHGQLWVCPEGLLRRPLGLKATIAHGAGPTVESQGRRNRRVEELRGSGTGRDLWIPWDAVQRAELRTGPITHSLHLDLPNHRRVKFLWRGVDGALECFQATLPGMLGARFRR